MDNASKLAYAEGDDRKDHLARAEGGVVEGLPMKLADYYWGVVYLYVLKKLFATRYEIMSTEDLTRVLLRDKA